MNGVMGKVSNIPMTDLMQALAGAIWWNSNYGNSNGYLNSYSYGKASGEEYGNGNGYRNGNVAGFGRGYNYD